MLPLGDEGALERPEGQLAVVLGGGVPVRIANRRFSCWDKVIQVIFLFLLL